MPIPLPLRILQKVYLDLTQGGRPLGRIVLGLFGETLHSRGRCEGGWAHGWEGMERGTDVRMPAGMQHKNVFVVRHSNV